MTVGIWIDLEAFTERMSPYSEGKAAYWDFECGYDDAEAQNPYPPLSPASSAWNHGFTDARNSDSL